MAPTTPLFAWTVPAFTAGSPVDHTWVTTYDNRISPYLTDAQVVAAGHNYWFSWGSFHSAGGTPSNPAGFLGQQAGDLALASCLVDPDQDSRIVAAARGTIFTYGVDGVCHQLSNQILYATGAGGAVPATVSRARGYMASVFVYGMYGLQHAAWAAKIAACKGANLVALAATGRTVMQDLPDDFADRARDALAHDDPKLLSDLLALRSDVHSFAAQRWPGAGQPAAATLNSRNQHLLDEAAKLLGPEKFEQVFGFSPEQRIDLVDPDVTLPNGAPPRLR